jgi:hypothetical protein
MFLERVLLMCRCFVCILCALALVVVLATTASAGAIRYTANADPTTVDGYTTVAGNQFWSKNDPSMTGVTPILDGATSIPALQVEDKVDNAWTLAATPADINAGYANGFSLSAKIRMDSLVPWLNPGGGTSKYYPVQSIAYHDTEIGDKSFWITWQPAVAGDGSVDIWYNSTNANSATPTPDWNIPGGCTGYHDYRLEYIPADGTVTFKVDNSVIASGLSPFDNSSWGNFGSYVQFGDGSSGAGNNCVVNYYEALWSTGPAAYTAPPVYVATPEPGTIVLLSTGLIGLLAYAWRKRK